jgi:hypothetical protein
MEQSLMIFPKILPFQWRKYCGGSAPLDLHLWWLSFPAWPAIN